MTGRLPFSNRYVFAKVMQDNPELCREMIERILGMPIRRIERIEVESEEASIARRSVRFDVFLQSDDAAFEVEMQAYEQRSLPKRMRYYRSQLDRRLLRKGAGFDELKPVYVIFICTYDPFGKMLPVYTFRSRCDEDPRLVFDDGSVDVVLNAAGDLSMASPDIACLLQFVGTDAVVDSFTGRLQEAVDDAYRDEEWMMGMSWLDWDIRDAKAAAAKEGRAEGLAAGHAEGLAEGRAEGRAEGLAEGHAEGLAEGLAEGHAEGCAEGRVEGAAEERKNVSLLIEAMEKAGCGVDEVIGALKSPDRDALYERYGIA